MLPQCEIHVTSSPCVALQFLGEYMKQTSTSPIVATKFAPLPWRLKSDDVVSAAKSSLNRLKLEKMGLYMIHW